jgi:Ni/Co efflux regulator RcnB
MTYDPNFNEASPEEDEASGSSLDLAPWVAPRAAEIRERHIQARAAERHETTMAKVAKWRRGDCLPRRERSAG